MDPKLPDKFVLLLLPHIDQLRKICIASLCSCQKLQCFSQDLLHTHILSISQQDLDRRDKPRVDITRKRRTRVITQNPHQHDRIVLLLLFWRIWLREVLMQLVRRSFGRRRTRLGGLDDSREVKELIALSLYIVISC